MKLPIVCPVCGDIMLTEFEDRIVANPSKKCNKRLSHSIICYSDSNDDVSQIILRICSPSLTYVKWLFYGKYVRIEAENAQTIRLPWFDPDFTDYRKLLDKIKTYIIFS